VNRFAAPILKHVIGELHSLSIFCFLTMRDPMFRRIHAIQDSDLGV
jgi:hypothetical protein